MAESRYSTCNQTRGAVPLNWAVEMLWHPAMEHNHVPEVKHGKILSTCFSASLNTNALKPAQVLSCIISWNRSSVEAWILTVISPQYALKHRQPFDLIPNLYNGIKSHTQKNGIPLSKLRRIHPFASEVSKTGWLAFESASCSPIILSCSYITRLHWMLKYEWGESQQKWQPILDAQPGTSEKVLIIKKTISLSVLKISLLKLQKSLLKTGVWYFLVL